MKPNGETALWTGVDLELTSFMMIDDIYLVDDIFKFDKQTNEKIAKVFSENYNNEHVLTACEIALLLSKKESGDVISTLVKHVYKGQKVGQVNIKENKNIFF